MSAVYDTIGTGYVAKRQPDPRIARDIRAALGAAARVLNVGAGAGSYEPADLPVLAVEPSREMIRQRPAGRAAVVQALAAAPLPVRVLRCRLGRADRASLERSPRGADRAGSCRAPSRHRHLGPRVP